MQCSIVGCGVVRSSVVLSKLCSVVQNNIVQCYSVLCMTHRSITEIMKKWTPRSLITESNQL